MHEGKVNWVASKFRKERRSMTGKHEDKIDIHIQENTLVNDRWGHE